jgi:hypothetical protein
MVYGYGMRGIRLRDYGYTATGEKVYGYRRKFLKVCKYGLIEK